MPALSRPDQHPTEKESSMAESKTEKATRGPRKSLADRAVEEYDKVVARQHRKQEATKRAENTFHNALTALTEITEEVKFWENHPAVKEHRLGGVDAQSDDQITDQSDEGETND